MADVAAANKQNVAELKAMLENTPVILERKVTEVARAVGAGAARHRLPIGFRGGPGPPTFGLGGPGH